MNGAAGMIQQTGPRKDMGGRANRPEIRPTSLERFSIVQPVALAELDVPTALLIRPQ